MAFPKFLGVFFGLFCITTLIRNGDCSIKIFAELGEPCNDLGDCQTGQSGDLSVCKDGFCACDDTKAIENPAGDKCLKIAEQIGDVCETTSQCTAGSLGGFGRCEGGFCQCNAGLSVPSTDGRRCLPKMGWVGDPCEQDDQCVNTDGPTGRYKVCLFGKCECASGAVREAEGHICYPVVDHVDDSCDISEQCTLTIGDLAECQGRTAKTCQCKAGAVANEEGDAKSKCYPGGLLITTPCVDRAQCLGRPRSLCTLTGGCDCLDGNVPSVNLDDCLAIQDVIGGRCQESQQCQKGKPGAFSECRLGTCNCTRDAVTEADQHVCYRKATLVGDECEKDVQCTAGLERSLCLGGKCECMDDATGSADGSKCILKSNMNEPCVEHNQCRHMGQAVCRAGAGGVSTCQCDQGYQELVINRCTRMASVVGDSCREHDRQCETVRDSQCQPNTRTCGCEAGIGIPSNDKKKCLLLQDALNSPCEETTQCLAKEAECRPITHPLSPKYCLCRQDHVVGTDDTNSCFPIRYKPGDHCNDNAQCAKIAINGTVICQGHICQCPPPTQFQNGLCVLSAGLGDPCTDHNECQAGVNNYTLCLGKDGNPGTCQCMTNTIIEDGSCWAIKAIGDWCGNSAECRMTILGPVECHNTTKTCSCEENYYSDMKGLRCSSGNMLSTQISFVIVAAFVSFHMF